MWFSWPWGYLCIIPEYCNLKCDRISWKWKKVIWNLKYINEFKYEQFKLYYTFYTKTLNNEKTNSIPEKVWEMEAFSPHTTLSWQNRVPSISQETKKPRQICNIMQSYSLGLNLFLLLSCILQTLELKHKAHICFKTVIPKKIEMNVATATPNMPTRIPGTTKDFQPLAVANPAAVVGPPTFALDAINNCFSSKPRNLPTPRMSKRWIAIWTKQNTNRYGAVSITLEMLAFAPTTTKNTWIPEEV